MRGGEGVGRLATVRRWFPSVVIDACLLFYVIIVLSSPVNWQLPIGMNIGEAYVTRSSYL
jgi:hypothetical protein